jgi:hypothetical protein
MLSRYARFALALELVLYLVTGAWLYQRWSWPLPAIVLAAIGAIVLSRLAIVASSIGLGHHHRSPRLPEHRLGARAWLGYAWREYLAWMEFNLLGMPWDRWWLRPDPPLAPTDRMPVLLVHGYFSNRGYFRGLARMLEARGAGPVYAPNFRTWFASIESFEEEIHAAIERIVAATGQPKVFVIAHSMGGLGMRAYLVRRGAGRIAGLVTLAAPHQGTALARFGSGENARQMRRGSVFLSELARMEEMARHPPILSVFTRHDNLVAPQEGSMLSWGRNVGLVGHGHIAMMEAPELEPLLLEAMRAAGALPAS